MGTLHAAVLLGHLPAQTLAEVSVAEAVELVPAWFAVLQVWKNKKTKQTQQKKKQECGVGID